MRPHTFLRKILAGAALCVLLMAATAYAGDMSFSGEEANISPAQQDFAARFVDVVNADDEARYFAEILHPASKAALEEHPKFFAQVQSNIKRRSLPDDYYVSVRKIGPDESLPFAPTLAYPVRPTHTFMISYDEPDGSGVSILLQVREDNDGIYEVFPVPSGE